MRPAGFEPATSGLGIPRSILLSYERIRKIHNLTNNLLILRILWLFDKVELYIPRIYFFYMEKVSMRPNVTQQVHPK